MRVKQIMTTDVKHGNRLTTVDEAVYLMKGCDIGFLPIVDEDASQALVGIVTDRDILLRAVCGHLDVRLMPLTDVMTEDVATIKPDDTLERALRLMATYKVRRLPVVDREKHLVGLVTLVDIVRSEAMAHKTVTSALRKMMAPARAKCVNRSLLLKTCAA